MALVRKFKAMIGTETAIQILLFVLLLLGNINLYVWFLLECVLSCFERLICGEMIDSPQYNDLIEGELAKSGILVALSLSVFLCWIGVMVFGWRTGQFPQSVILVILQWQFWKFLRFISGKRT